jgi:hypothetical protein
MRVSGDCASSHRSRRFSLEHAPETGMSSPDWKVGDTLIADGNRRYRVTAIVPPPRLEEFVDGALNGMLRAALGIREDRVRPDASPDDVSLARPNRISVMKRGSRITAPRHLKDTGCALHSLHPEASPKWPASFEVSYEAHNRVKECSLFAAREGFEIATEPRHPLICWHYSAARSRSAERKSSPDSKRCERPAARSSSASRSVSCQ